MVAIEQQHVENKPLTSAGIHAAGPSPGTWHQECTAFVAWTGPSHAHDWRAADVHTLHDKRYPLCPPLDSRLPDVRLTVPQGSSRAVHWRALAFKFDDLARLDNKLPRESKLEGRRCTSSPWPTSVLYPPVDGITSIPLLFMWQGSCREGHSKVLAVETDGWSAGSGRQGNESWRVVDVMLSVAMFSPVLTNHQQFASSLVFCVAGIESSSPRP